MSYPRYSWTAPPFKEDLNAETLGSESVVRGVHAQHPVMTPKWFSGAADAAYRKDLARMFLPISPADMVRFMDSVNLDASTIYKNTDPAGVAPTLAKSLTGKGYMDFFLTQVTRGFQEKVDVMEMVSDNFVAYYFGAAPEVWLLTGVLLNTEQDDQAVNMYRIYKQFIRGTQLAKRRTLVHIRYDSYIVAGTVQGMNDALNGDNEMSMPFMLNLLVHRVYIRPRKNQQGRQGFGLLKPDDPFDAGVPIDPVTPLSAYSYKANYELLGTASASVNTNTPSTSQDTDAALRIAATKVEQEKATPNASTLLQGKAEPTRTYAGEKGNVGEVVSVGRNLQIGVPRGGTF